MPVKLDQTSKQLLSSVSVALKCSKLDFDIPSQTMSSQLVMKVNRLQPVGSQCLAIYGLFKRNSALTIK
jgi:hypothetical protein